MKKLTKALSLLLVFLLVSAQFSCTSQSDDIKYLKEKHRESKVKIFLKESFYIVEDTNGCAYMYENTYTLPDKVVWSNDEDFFLYSTED